jgi:alpha-L-fucosidase
MPFGIYYAQREWYHPDYQPVDPSKVERDGLWWTLKPGETSPVGPRHRRYLEYNRNAVRELLTRYGKVDLFWWDAAWWGGMFTAEMWDAENLTRFVRQLQPHILQNNRCSVPGDFDTPEQRLGSYQDWRPWETVTPLAEEWGNPLSPVKPLSQLVSMIVHTASCDGNLLLGLGPCTSEILRWR